MCGDAACGLGEGGKMDAGATCIGCLLCCRGLLPKGLPAAACLSGDMQHPDSVLCLMTFALLSTVNRCERDGTSVQSLQFLHPFLLLSPALAAAGGSQPSQWGVLVLVSSNVARGRWVADRTGGDTANTPKPCKAEQCTEQCGAEESSAQSSAVQCAVGIMRACMHFRCRG